MPDATLDRPCADRNLLFGILALQMDFISRDALIVAMHAWVLDKGKPLGHILVEQGALQPNNRELLEPLVDAHLKLHGGDYEMSLAVLSLPEPVRRELHRLSDDDVQASVARLPTPLEDGASRTGLSTMPMPPAGGLRYRVLRPHGKGGIGEVFVALDQELNREVALKEIQEQHADDSDCRARFLLEAEITGALEHPGIVPIYGLGQYDDGRPFYAMRFIKGDSLKQAVERFHQAEVPGRDPGERRLALRQLLGRFIGVCNAVAYAHSRGVLHRDIKPGNIMLGKYGETLLVDWGLAKVVGRTDATPNVEESTFRPSFGSGEAMTQMGSAIGTPAYMSPEQASGRLDKFGPASLNFHGTSSNSQKQL
jgi:tRNA A-37 threonylcarbamoyl transferase component Bud32